MSLIDKINETGKTIRNITAGVGLAAILSGCAQTPEQQANTWRLIGMGYGMGAMNPNLTAQQQAASAALSQFSYATAQQEAMKAAAEAGKSNVTVNVNQPGRENLNRPLIYTCTGFDKNWYPINFGIAHVRKGQEVCVVGDHPSLIEKADALYAYLICVTNGKEYEKVKVLPPGDVWEKGRLRYFENSYDWFNDRCPKGTWASVWEEKLPNGEFKEIARVYWTYLDWGR